MNNPNRFYWSKIVAWKVLTLIFGVWCTLGPYSPIWGKGEWNWDNMLVGKSGFLLFSMCCLILGFVLMWAGSNQILIFASGKKSYSINDKETISIDDDYGGGIELFVGTLFFFPLLIFSERLQRDLLTSSPIVNISKLSSILSIFILASVFFSSRLIFVHRPIWPFSKNIIANLFAIILLILLVLGICTVITTFWYFSTKEIFTLYRNLYLDQQQEISREYGPGLSRSFPYGLVFWSLVLVGTAFFVYSILFLPMSFSRKCLERIQHTISPIPKV